MWTNVDNALTRHQHLLKTASEAVDNDCGQMCTTLIFLTRFSEKNHSRK
jgi:hypothetical protein